MYYIFSDIHGTHYKLVALFNKIKDLITDDDVLVFVGDYIDRGQHSFEVLEYLIGLAEKYPIVFLKGNHEDMFIKYLRGEDPSKIYVSNGGYPTIDSYRKNLGSMDIPGSHREFFNRLVLYYEADDFIAVHAGFNPTVRELGDQSEFDMLWIRENFYRNTHHWEKTIVFGHTPTYFMRKRIGEVFIDNEKNIIGIDTGAVYGGLLTCLRMPDRKIFQS